MKKLIVVSLLIIALPFMASVNNSSIAYAGRVIHGGAYCTCGDPDCIYDPGECGGQNTNAATVASGRDITTNNGSIDSGSGVMFLAFALLILFRLGSK